MATFDDASTDSWQYKCLWEQICDFLKPQEMEEVRAAIGHDIIEKNQELLNEIASLSEILDEFREKNDTLVEEKRKKSIKKREMLTSGSDRKLVEQQIKMLLRESASVHSMKPVLDDSESSKVMSYLTTIDTTTDRPSLEDEELLNLSWVRDHNTHSLPNSARPMSALSSARISARSCPNHSLTSDVIGNGKCINATDIGAVVGCLRRGFKKEKDTLIEEIDMLMGMFEDEHNRGNQVEEQIPTTTELREFSSKLEREVKQMPVTTMLLDEKPPLSSSTCPISRKILPSLQPVQSTKGLTPFLVPPLPIEKASPLGRTGSKLSSKFKSQVADAKETSRDDFHLTGDDASFFM
eukprot:CAMPEP_0114349400 /NCGR_PEP_ID=MMETSP0101-20121206/15508_1 /TAXON_ID=38822 ORGANISM="Pteridomonas danica, Strain PT" /NCGR_SAMPLE_ID=MMETSP0101 /ASSEMBLY_ACC=CAM_ASM_000211 /LENGTH=351 /DNA_ID=CAMNT_0001487963 /DNA_START=160 /DNA_END=1215 /DNA_ORIENTATION=+